MSYDISLELAACEACGSPARTVGDWNHTYNCWQMFDRAITGTKRRSKDKPSGINYLHGKKACDVVDKLAAGVKDMQENRAVYEQYNPKNEWGSYETARNLMVNLLEAATMYPSATFHIC